MKRVRVLLADDHVLFREGLAGILSAQPDIHVVGEAGDGLEALVKARELAPDLILMDISMPGFDGIQAARRIKAELPSVTIVMLTVQDDDARLFEAIRSGAQGYLLKSIGSSELVRLLRGAVRGEAAITPGLAGRMLEEFRRLGRQSPDASAGDIEALTIREQEVLRLVASGLSDKEIAADLGISLYTVKSHMRNILSKLHLSRRHEAARLALRMGLIDPPERPPE